MVVKWQGEREAKGKDRYSCLLPWEKPYLGSLYAYNSTANLKFPLGHLPICIFYCGFCSYTVNVLLDITFAVTLAVIVSWGWGVSVIVFLLLTHLPNLFLMSLD